uniref:Uncharacterized protein n=1 Tax=Amblyomma aureolatum TaxID=187763 RepID=A0A1E1WWA0_9ACAR
MNTSGSILSFSLNPQVSVLCKLDYNIETNDAYTSFSRYVPSSGGRTPAVAAQKNTASRSRVFSVTGEFYNALPGDTYDAMKTTYDDGIMFTEAIDSQSPDNECAVFSVAARRSSESKGSAPRRQSIAQSQTRRATVEQEFRIKITAVGSGKTEDCYRKLQELLPALKVQVTSGVLERTPCWSKYKNELSETDPQNSNGN